MEDQQSDSSSYETSSEEEMVTDSESDSDENEKHQASEPFVLPFLQNDDKIIEKKKMNAYLQNNKHFSTKKLLHLFQNESKPTSSNFTPWWEGLNANKKSDKSTAPSDEITENQLYDSWFEKSNSNKDDSSWLCGPKPKSSNPNSIPQVEDIEVPSIFGNISQPKGRRALKRERKEARNKTTGKKWFDMKLPDVDGKTKMDMELLQMRRALDPKRFYKQNDRTGLPKYFQLGTVVDEGSDFYSSRLTKKQRKQTLVEELMADENIRQYNKRKYEEVQQKQRAKKFTKKRKT